MEWINVAGQAVSWLVQQPAVQGVAVAAVTEAVKKAPVGPSGGPGVRLLAAVLALGSVFASAAAQGSMEAVSPRSWGNTSSRPSGRSLRPSVRGNLRERRRSDRFITDAFPDGRRRLWAG